jgi:ferritin-like metal-binding protein YciE
MLKYTKMKTIATKGATSVSSGKSTGTKKEPSHHEKAGAGNAALHSLFIAELRDIYWAEKYLLRNFPYLINEATSEELKQGITIHFHQTEEHITRLEKAFEILEEKPIAEKCEAMEGLMTETNKRVADTEEGSMVRDTAIACCSLKAEHYEIATYTSLQKMAAVMEYPEVEKLLASILKDEENAQIFLTKAATAFMDDYTMAVQK